MLTTGLKDSRKCLLQIKNMFNPAVQDSRTCSLQVYKIHENVLFFRLWNSMTSLLQNNGIQENVYSSLKSFKSFVFTGHEIKEFAFSEL